MTLYYCGVGTRVSFMSIGSQRVVLRIARCEPRTSQLSLCRQDSTCITVAQEKGVPWTRLTRYYAMSDYPMQDLTMRVLQQSAVIQNATLRRL